MDQTVKGNPRSFGRDSAILTSCRRFSEVMIAGRPYGLVAFSNSENPDSLNVYTH